MTEKFIEEMIDWFKSGKNLPRRYAWEIILGAYSHFVKEESLVNLDVEEGMTCDVIGDVHGWFEPCSFALVFDHYDYPRSILRSLASIFINRHTHRKTLSSHEWRSCRPRIMVN
jgi:hypothetical protein